MNEMKNHLLAAGTVLTVLVCLFLGSVKREQIETGSPVTGLQAFDAPKVASTSPGEELSETKYFTEMVQLLKKAYVEPVKENDKLATGAVRGMIGSLADPNATFLAPDQFKSYQAQLKGEFEGIGAEFRYIFDGDQLKKAQSGSRSVDVLLLIPDLVVSAVLPGSEAEKAGLSVGDRINGVNGKWLVSASEIKKLRELQTQARDGKIDNKELMKLRNELREKAKNNVTPSRARELLTQGKDGTVKVGWVHGTQEFTKDLTRTKLSIKAVQKTGNVISLRFFAGAENGLKSSGATNGDVTLDLRQSTQGSYSTMRACLEILAPADTFGTVVTERKGRPAEFATTKGAATKHRYELIVDGSTRGAAEVFALAMSSRGYATLKGAKTAGDLALIDVKSLPDGSGYLLPIGVFRPNLGYSLTGGTK